MMRVDRSIVAIVVAAIVGLTVMQVVDLVTAADRQRAGSGCSSAPVEHPTPAAPEPRPAPHAGVTR